MTEDIDFERIEYLRDEHKASALYFAQKEYESAQKINGRLTCELCPHNCHYTAYKQHLIKVHGWRYIDGVFPEPVEE